MVVDFRGRLAMSSFRELFEHAKKDPHFVYRLLNDAAAMPASDPYPAQYAAIFLLGMIQGAASASFWSSKEAFFGVLADGHKEMLEWSPRDFIGASRKWGKGSGM